MMTQQVKLQDICPGDMIQVGEGIYRVCSTHTLNGRFYAWCNRTDTGTYHSVYDTVVRLIKQ